MPQSMASFIQFQLKILAQDEMFDFLIAMQLILPGEIMIPVIHDTDKLDAIWR